MTDSQPGLFWRVVDEPREAASDATADGRQGFWPHSEMVAMDERFCNAMRHAREGKKAERRSVAHGLDQAPMRAWHAWGDGAMPASAATNMPERRDPARARCPRRCVSGEASGEPQNDVRTAELPT
jgi:hypothetical protein